MVVPKQRYAAAETEADTESARLAIFESHLDPATARRLEAVGVSTGWRCLEVGAGRGSVARLLAEKVGPSGAVVATDVDTRFLTGMDLPQVDVRRHDVLHDPIDDGPYDLAHCRFVLSHVPAPEDAMSRMVAALRPGGWLLVEEVDYSAFGPADDGHPLAALTRRVGSAMIDTLGSKAMMDAFFGRSLLSLLARAGLSERAADGFYCLGRGGSSTAQMVRGWLEVTRDVVVAAGSVSPDDYDKALTAWDDPTYTFATWSSVGAWGRRT